MLTQFYKRNQQVKSMSAERVVAALNRFSNESK